VGMTISGLGSGLDTAGLVDQLMQIESIPQLLLKNSVSQTRADIKALQDLNSRVASLADKAAAAAKPSALALFTTSASSDGVSAVAGTGASAGSIDIVVGSVAKAQVSVTAGMAQAPATTYTITTAAGSTEITAASTSLDDVAAAINGSGAGVRATKVAAGTDANQQPIYRLQLTSAATGAAGKFDLHAGTAADVQAGTATDLFTEDGAAHVTAASDAQVTLWAGTAAAQTITSATNTFANLLPGVDITVSKTSADPVTVTVAEDTEARTTTAKELVGALTDIFSFIDARTKVSTAANGSTTGGVFTGESVVRDAKQALLSAATAPVGGRSPSEVGITITRDGTVTFDAEKFAKALKDDPAFASEVFTTIATRVQDTAKNLSDSYDGRLTSSIKNRETSARNIDDEIAAWDRRLALRRTTLEATWANLEVQMSAMQAQQQWLAGQLASLSTSMLPSNNKS
jgi:flagellar hook-associated protein 2